MVSKRVKILAASVCALQVFFLLFYSAYSSAKRGHHVLLPKEQTTINYHKQEYRENEEIKRIGTTIIKYSKYGEWFHRRHTNAGADLVNITLTSYKNLGKTTCKTKTRSYSALNQARLGERRSIAKEAGKQLGIKAGDSIFEVGTGCGAWLDDFQHIFNFSKFGGIDISPSNIKAVRTHHPNGTFYEADMRTLYKTIKAEDKVWDHVYSWGVLQFLNNPSEVCSVAHQMYKMLRPGGSLWFGLNEEVSMCRTPKHRIWGWIILPDQFWRRCFAEINVGVSYHFEKTLYKLAKPLYCHDTDSIFVRKPK